MEKVSKTDLQHTVADAAWASGTAALKNLPQNFSAVNITAEVPIGGALPAGILM